MTRFNETVGSYERSVLTAARRFDDLGVAESPVPTPEPLEATVRTLRPAEPPASRRRDRTTRTRRRDADAPAADPAPGAGRRPVADGTPPGGTALDGAPSGSASAVARRLRLPVLAPAVTVSHSSAPRRPRVAAGRRSADSAPARRRCASGGDRGDRSDAPMPADRAGTAARHVGSSAERLRAAVRARDRSLRPARGRPPAAAAPSDRPAAATPGRAPRCDSRAVRPRPRRPERRLAERPRRPADGDVPAPVVGPRSSVTAAERVRRRRRPVGAVPTARASVDAGAAAGPRAARPAPPGAAAGSAASSPSLAVFLVTLAGGGVDSLFRHAASA